MHRLKGFTLIELLVVLSIAAILLMSASPFMSSLMARNRSAAVADRLMSAIAFAKNIAVQYGLPITLCKSADQKTCSGSWSDGQIILMNKNGEANILRVFPGTAAGDQLRWKGFISTDYLVISPTMWKSSMNGSFTYCPPLAQRQYAWRLVINRVGRMRLDKRVECD